MPWQLATQPDGEILQRLTDLQAQVDHLVALQAGDQASPEPSQGTPPHEKPPNDVMATSTDTGALAGVEPDEL
jgi:hypothetical protein